MTILIATLGRDFGVISQDSIITDVSKVATLRPFGISTDEAEQRSSAFTGDGMPPADLIGDGVMSKISVMPHMHMIVGYLAMLHHVAQWDAFLRFAPAIGLGSLDVSDACRQLYVGEHGVQGFKALHFGWCHYDRRVRGVLHYNDGAWRRQKLEPGHVVYPACDPEDPEFSELPRRAWPAATGQEVEAFHVAIARNIYRTFLRGRYAKGAVFGGQLHTARVDAVGICVKVSHVFDAANFG